MSDVVVVVGGIIPDADIPALKSAGIAEVFVPGTPMQRIIDFINGRVRPRVEVV
jgi:methylmalonyl-CoA mutase C-terminal domain/subunit